MTILLFHEDTGHSITSYKTTKGSYLCFLMSNIKKGVFAFFNFESWRNREIQAELS